MKLNRIPFLFFTCIALIAIAGPYFAPYNPFHYDLSLALSPPDGIHIMGCDENGRDILSRILFGTRVSLGIALSVMAITSTLGLMIGFVSGYFGGVAEKAFLVVADIFQAFPGILLAIAVAAFLPPSILNTILLLSFVGWVGFARVTRAQVLSAKQRDYVQAARAIGVTSPFIFLRHILPNIAGPLLVQATFGMAGVILTESTLSFLGLGIPVEVPSWGRMLDRGASLLLVAPHISIFPGLAIMITVLTFNLMGDRLRDRFSR